MPFKKFNPIFLSVAIVHYLWLAQTNLNKTCIMASNHTSWLINLELEFIRAPCELIHAAWPLNNFILSCAHVPLLWFIRHQVRDLRCGSISIDYLCMGACKLAVHKVFRPIGQLQANCKPITFRPIGLLCIRFQNSTYHFCRWIILCWFQSLDRFQRKKERQTMPGNSLVCVKRPVRCASRHTSSWSRSWTCYESICCAAVSQCDSTPQISQRGARTRNKRKTA